MEVLLIIVLVSALGWWIIVGVRGVLTVEIVSSMEVRVLHLRKGIFNKVLRSTNKKYLLRKTSGYYDNEWIDDLTGKAQYKTGRVVEAIDNKVRLEMVRNEVSIEEARLKERKKRRGC